LGARKESLPHFFYSMSYRRNEGHIIGNEGRYNIVCVIIHEKNNFK
jgi:hypothetical protein